MYGDFSNVRRFLYVDTFSMRDSLHIFTKSHDSIRIASLTLSYVNFFHEEMVTYIHEIYDFLRIATLKIVSDYLSVSLYREIKSLSSQYKLSGNGFNEKSPNKVWRS